MTETSTSSALDALRASQARLTAALGSLDESGVAVQSYDDDWVIAQVASHLGSGAEIFTLFLEAGSTGAAGPGPEVMQPIWDVWNAKAPLAQARDAVAANDEFLARIDALGEEQREAWSLDVFGATRDLGDFLRMRLSEHALHTWDIVVVADPTATVSQDGAAEVIGGLAVIAGWTGQKRDEPLAVEIATTDPELRFRLDVGPEGVALVPSDGGDGPAALTLPTEALIRLVYGRLDPDHTPSSVRAEGVDLDVLRATFPGV